MAKPATSRDRHSMSLTVAARGVYYFKVEDYSFLRNKSFQSDTFGVGGYDWAVRFKHCSMLEKVSLCLVMLSKPEGRVSASFACALMDKNGEPSAATEKRVCKTFFCRGGKCDILNFVNEECLGKFIQRDCFDVRCTVSVHRKPI